MSTNEKTSANAKLNELINSYNEELTKDAPSVTELAKIEGECKEQVAIIGNDLMTEKLNSFLVYENPMLECARTLEISVPTVKIEREKGTGVPTAMVADTKKRSLSASTLTSMLRKYNWKKEGFVGNGVMTNGSSWLYKAEKFASLMTQRVAKKLEVDADAQKTIKETYKLSDNAKKINGVVKDPTSNKQMCSLLQEIMDALVYVDNGNGSNAIHCTNRDVDFIEMKFTSRDSKNARAIKVAAGKNIADYIFQVAHAIVTGKPYEVTGFKQEDGSSAVAYKPFKEPTPVSPMRPVPVKDEGVAA